jgi:hypothetical protein
MQQVVVPQFLDVEDKIIGPITVRQFIELVIGGLIEVIMYRLLDFPAFVVFGLILLAITVVVAFARINGQPFHLFLLNFIQTLKNPKLKVWRKAFDLQELKDQMAKQVEIKKATIIKRPVTVSKISEIALLVDTGGVYQGENGN